MFPALISAGASLIGGILGNDASAKQADENREFQERMSSSAHQREVEDLRQAGLNPILSATRGMGASTPPGSVAPQHDVLTPAMASAMAAWAGERDSKRVENETEKNLEEVRQLKKTNERLLERLKNIEELTFERANLTETDRLLRQKQIGTEHERGEVMFLERARVRATTEQLMAQTKTEAERAKLTEAEHRKVVEEILTEPIRRRTIQQQGDLAGHSARSAGALADLDDSEYGRIMRGVQRAIDAIRGGSSAYRNTR